MQIKIEGAETLERIAAALERIATARERALAALETENHVFTNAPAQMTESVKSAPVEVEAPKPEPQIAEPEPVAAEPVADQPEEVKQTVTLDEIRKKVVQLSAAGAQVKEAVRAIITEYGRNVSAIPADKYVLVMDRLNAVKEG